MPGLSRQYAKLCDVRDFADPEFLHAVRSLIPEREPLEYVERKVWELAILALFMREAGLLTEHTEALSVGAGDERVLFWLANRIGRIVATDIYGRGPFADQEARSSMLTDPGAHAPYPYRQDRLQTLWMDARRLEFPDESFDLAFTISSIEHFGSRRDISQAARELGRVVKPGGYAVIITDCIVRLHPLDATPVGFAVRTLSLGRRSSGARPLRRGMLGETFTRRELHSRIIRPSGLGLVQPIDVEVSPETWDTLRQDPAPPLLVRAGRSYLTSVCLVLAKPGA